MPFLHVTTRIEGRKHDELLYDYDENSFPTILVLDHKGGLVARHRGWPTLPAFRITAGKVQQLPALQKKAAAGDAAAKIDLLLLECELLKTDFAEVEEALEGKDLSDAQKKKLAGLGADTDVAEIVPVLRRSRWSAEALADAGEMFAEHLGKGGIPQAVWNRGPFWLGLGYYAAANKKKDLYSRSLKELASLELLGPAVKRKIEDLKKRAPA